jgi:hypothetical protein
LVFWLFRLYFNRGKLILEKVGEMNDLERCEGLMVALSTGKANVWSCENIPVVLRGIAQKSNVSASVVSMVVSKYSNSLNSLKSVLSECGITTAMMLRLCDTYPEIAQEMELAERTRARNMEAAATEAYNGTIEETLQHIAVEKITRDGDSYTDYSSAAATQLKNRASVLMKSAGVADKKRYGDNSEGQTINIGVQTNVDNGPASLDDLQNMSIVEMMDNSRPGSN